MAYQAPGDYLHISTPEPEATARRSSNATERQALSDELSRRYASIYRPPNDPPRKRPVGQQRQARFSANGSVPLKDREEAGKITRVAVWSLLLAVVWVVWWGSLAGIIVGLIALRQIRDHSQRGRRLAIDLGHRSKDR